MYYVEILNDVKIKVGFCDVFNFWEEKDLESCRWSEEVFLFVKDDIFLGIVDF